MRVHCCRKYTILDVEMKRTVTSERTIDSRTIRIDVTLIQAEGEDRYCRNTPADLAVAEWLHVLIPHSNVAPDNPHRSVGLAVPAAGKAGQTPDSMRVTSAGPERC
jgi:hypothetical protein